MGRPSKYSQELRERAVRLVFDHASDYSSHWRQFGLWPRRSGARSRCCVDGCDKPSAMPGPAQGSALDITLRFAAATSSPDERNDRCNHPTVAPCRLAA